MKNLGRITLYYVILFSAIIILPGFVNISKLTETSKSSKEINDSKKEVLEILETKCNVCHRDKNRFMIFKLENMDKRARKIYRQVFVKQRMPKGDEIVLTEEEKLTLENWLLTKNVQ